MSTATKKKTLDLMQFPEYAAARAAYERASTALSEANRNITEMENELLQKQDGSHRTDQVTTEALALLNGRDGTFTVDGGEGLRKKLADARHARTVAEKALDISNRNLVEVTSQASRKICSQEEQRHRQIVKTLALSIIKMGEAIAEEELMRDEFILAGVTFTEPLKPMGFQRAGHPHDAYSAIAMWLKEAIGFGYIERKDIPEAWRKAWGW